MRSILEGLTAEQLGRWQNVAGFRLDPELGEGRLVAGTPPVFRPVDPDPPGRPVQRFLNWLPARHPQDLGPSRYVGAPSGGRLRGFPPTAPPAGASSAIVPPAWAVAVSPDSELRNDSPSRGNY